MKIPALHLPLLAKELAEQAARKRTYLLRILYAGALFGCFGLVLHETFANARGNALRIFGSGKSFFDGVVYLQFIGIYIFLPALMSGVVTYEKERDTLTLLFLTDLRPWEIILQKYLGRLVPMFTLLLLSLPLLAIAYAFGGISQNHLWSGIYLLVLTCLQVGALALMCSCFCRTTASAFLASYIVGALFFFAPFILVYGGMSLMGGTSSIFPVVFSPKRSVDQWDALGIFLPPYYFSVWENESFANVAFGSAAIVVSTFMFLLLARAFLVRRAQVQPRNVLLRLFKHLDRLMESMNEGFGGITVLTGKATLPEYEPIAWREVTKRSLGKVVYITRIVVAVEAVVLLSATIFVNFENAISLSVLVLWVMAVLAVTAQSVNTIVSERTNQTLDVLLATPMTGAQIISEKMSGIYRLILVLAIPFALLFLLECWWERGLHLTAQNISYLAASVLEVAIFLPMFAWVAMWIGLRSRGRFRAIITAFTMAVVWNAIGYVALWLPGDFPFQPFPSWSLVSTVPGLFIVSRYYCLLSPATLVLFSEGRELATSASETCLWLFLGFLWHIGITIFFWQLCLKNADRYLGRAKGKA